MTNTQVPFRWWGVGKGAELTDVKMFFLIKVEMEKCGQNKGKQRCLERAFYFVVAVVIFLIS